MPNATAIARRDHPWYRDRWPWLLMAGPIIVVVAGFGTAWLAWSTDDGVVADDYYKRGLVINRELERAGRGEMLRLSAVLAIAPDGAVRLELSGAAGMDDAAGGAGAVRQRNARGPRPDGDPCPHGGRNVFRPHRAVATRPLARRGRDRCLAVAGSGSGRCRARGAHGCGARAGLMR